VKQHTGKKLRWFHIVLIVIIALLLLSISPIYPSRIYSSQDGKALVALTFDDGYACWTSTILPILQQYDMPATGYITDPEYRQGFTWENAQELVSAGWEIGWHTVKHVPVDTLQRSDLVDDFSQAAPLFTAHGLPTPVTFAYPSGRHSSVAMDVASDYFLASRTMETGVNTPLDVKNSPQHLEQFSMEKGLAYLEKKIRKYAGQNVLVVFAGHTVGEVAPWQKKPDISVDDFTALVEFLHQEEAAGTIDVVTLKDGVQQIQQNPGSQRWRLEVDSPFDTWYHFWIIPVPERYYIYYQAIFEDWIGHRYPQVVHLVNRYK
jgi:peptidoglycan/xylan/chitin deacetylase (PgdA/CDA1 family)